MKIHQKYGIAIADNVYHKVYGFGSYQPSFPPIANKYRVIFGEGVGEKIVSKEELYHFEAEWFEIIYCLIFPWILFLGKDAPIIRIKEI